MGEFYIILYISVWIITYLVFRKKREIIGPASVIILSYVVYAFFSLRLYKSDILEYNNITFFPFVYLYLMLIIALAPVMRFEKTRIDAVQHINNNIVNTIFYIFIITSIIVLPSTISSLLDGFSILFASDSGAIDLYEEAHSTQMINANSQGGIVGYCKIIRYLLYEVCVFLFFYYLTLNNRKKIVILLLIISFCIDLVFSLAKGMRTSSTMSAFTIFITYMIFRPYLDVNINRSISKIGLIIGGIFIFLTIIVTISRTTNRDGGAMEGLVEYVGQANLNFNEYALDAGGTRNGDRTLNYFKRLIGYDIPPSITGIRQKYQYMKLNDSVFSTFVGDFVLDFGPLIVPLLFIIFSVFSCFYTRIKKRQIGLEKLLIIQYISLVCMHGGMYLYYYSFSGNYITLFYIIMILIFRFNKSKSYTYVQR